MDGAPSGAQERYMTADDALVHTRCQKITEMRGCTLAYREQATFCFDFQVGA